MADGVPIGLATGADGAIGRASGALGAPGTAGRGAAGAPIKETGAAGMFDAGATGATGGLANAAGGISGVGGALGAGGRNAVGAVGAAGVGTDGAFGIEGVAADGRLGADGTLAPCVGADGNLGGVGGIAPGLNGFGADDAPIGAGGIEGFAGEDETNAWGAPRTEGVAVGELGTEIGVIGVGTDGRGVVIGFVPTAGRGFVGATPIGRGATGDGGTLGVPSALAAGEPIGTAVGIFGITGFCGAGFATGGRLIRTVSRLTVGPPGPLMGRGGSVILTVSFFGSSLIGAFWGK